MSARRCSRCDIDWPNTAEYEECAYCLEETDPVRNIKPMDEEEAKSQKKQFEFERFYENWDDSHDPERLNPDSEIDTITETSKPG